MQKRLFEPVFRNIRPILWHKETYAKAANSQNRVLARANPPHWKQLGTSPSASSIASAYSDYLCISALGALWEGCRLRGRNWPFWTFRGLPRKLVENARFSKCSPIRRVNVLKPNLSGFLGQINPRMVRLQPSYSTGRCLSPKCHFLDKILGPPCSGLLSYSWRPKIYHFRPNSECMFKMHIQGQLDTANRFCAILKCRNAYLSPF